MDVVTVRELRNHGGDVLSRVERGEVLLVTRDGIEVAELRPLRRASLSAAILIARRAALPDIDVAALKSDIDLVLGAEL
jgi:prevent-host-death family protein